jgi:hypothetical protein
MRRAMLAEERSSKLKHILARANATLAEFMIELAAFDREKQFLDRS